MPYFLRILCEVWIGLKKTNPAEGGVCYEKWFGAESNRRHKDFQSFALPTELPNLPLGRQIYVDF